MAAATHVVSSRKNTPESAVTRPPAPRCEVRAPDSSWSKLTGPRLDATTIVDSIALGKALVPAAGMPSSLGG